MIEEKDRNLQGNVLQKPMEFTVLVSRIIKDISLLLLVGCTLFFLMALIGYDPKDSGWSHIGYQPDISNWTGRFGALCADIIFSFLGMSAWFVPVFIIYTSARLYLRKNVSLIDSLPFVMLRTVGLIIFVFTLSALLSLHVSNTTFQFPFTVGGIIGQALSEWMVSWFSLAGSSLLLWFSVFIGLTIFMELSWRDIVIGLGSIILFCVDRIGSLFNSSDKVNDFEDSEEQAAHPGSNEYHESVLETNIPNTFVTNKKVDFADKRMSVNSPLTNEEFDSSSEQQESQINSVEESSTVLKKIGAKPQNIINTLVDKVSTLNKSERSTINDEFKEPTFEIDTISKERESEEQYLHSSNVDNVTKADNTEQTIKNSDNNEVMASALRKEKAHLSRSQNKPDLESTDVSTKALEESKRPLKIVPLSETHQSILEQDQNHFDQKLKDSSPSAVSAIPSIDILDAAEPLTELGYTPEELENMSRLLEVKLKDFGVVVEVVEVNPGPVITRFEIQPAPGVKSSKIVNLAKDLARSLAVMSVRVVEVIPGKSVMGIEIPNINRKMVRLSEVLNDEVYSGATSRLTLALGNDIAGNPVVANLAKMPHLLVAGTTGSGKSVGVNAMILSLLFKAGPEDVRLMLVDPKMLELSIYEGIPHLLTPVITDMKEAAGGLRWCVAEMERRYKLMSKMGVRNLDGFNDKIRNAIKAGEPLLDPLWDPQEYGETPGTPAPQLETLPFIVVVIDEFADMMMIVGKKVEELIARIAQKARAAGIHLILATQRPSVDVITGLIKANVPTRIAFQVSSKIDSRTILDQGGSENLLGNGDMLYLPAGTSVPSRVHGAFVSDDEVHRTVDAWKKQGKPEFIDMQVSEEGASGASGNLFEDDEQDAVYDEAVAFVTTTRKVSISSVQRKFKIGYNRAARIVESMENAGVVSSAATNGQRDVLAPPPPPRD